MYMHRKEYTYRNYCNNIIIVYGKILDLPVQPRFELCIRCLISSFLFNKHLPSRLYDQSSSIPVAPSSLSNPNSTPSSDPLSECTLDHNSRPSSGYVFTNLYKLDRCG